MLVVVENCIICILYQCSFTIFYSNLWFQYFASVYPVCRYNFADACLTHQVCIILIDKRHLNHFCTCEIHRCRINFHVIIHRRVAGRFSAIWICISYSIVFPHLQCLAIELHNRLECYLLCIVRCHCCIQVLDFKRCNINWINRKFCRGGF